MSNIAFLFPGQGAQTVGMAQELVEQLPSAAALFTQASEILGYDLAQLCAQGPAEKLNTTDHSQPALFVASLAALESLKASDPQTVDACTATAGLSLGEYTALVFAGVMSFEDGLRVVQQRGSAMQVAAQQADSTMVSLLRLSTEDVQQLIDSCREDGEVLQIANYLCPGNIVVSGSRTACERIQVAAVEAGAMKPIPLAVAGAFHTEVMQAAVEPLRQVLENIPLNAPRIPVISNVDASVHSDPEIIRQHLVQQVVSPVRWEECMGTLLNQGVEQFYEIGPGRVLRGLLRRINRKTPCQNVSC
ncbi:MAG: ACP S-malonyltransferase [Planctomycetaceae bacterium]|jgi:[acyl-carrier-protein] S-malonyltransferase|nr:ACP S-malonyltransferase [Planctomycetaceae bacterium]MBT4012723.1 ACP S-malonyltransferase [Planctomycetaceae bacterium]MBT4726648.1 ACP S-malonyltransferase [Planctomycetaceae bacterium]MBT4845556.1 ACP S-malonyltransferase [Planctomycetaceae bacterium]MBT5126184.1 ACP S-malonyltransferase [Planctomycetaceae bacterium]